ncbi:MAG TPA: hypothetical protein VD993_02440 [Chitinophagaceae bacterium]|nr:hypothetical protein [Chitinophagaceae bacterium]
MNPSTTLRRIRYLIVFFIIVLALSGITAFPVYTELQFITRHSVFPEDSMIQRWLQQVWMGVKDVHDRHPFLFYGYDWLAFAHIMIAVLFIGPYRHPVRNKWVIDWGIIACLAILPLAMIAGPIRGIPWFHILIDCSFGMLGIIPLLVVKRWIRQLEVAQYQ